MRSSERPSRRAWRLSRAFACLSAALPVACGAPSVPLSSSPVAAPPARATCVAARTDAEPVDSTRLLALRRSIERGPLYAAATAGSTSRLAACRVEQSSEAMTLHCNFTDGSRVRATHDPRIEYSEQVARLVASIGVPAIVALQRAERAAFGAEGCGIDWRRNEARIAPAEAGATDTVFSGEVCNCQGRIRSDASGRVVELAFKSAC